MDWPRFAALPDKCSLIRRPPAHSEVLQITACHYVLDILSSSFALYSLSIERECHFQLELLLLPASRVHSLPERSLASVWVVLLSNGCLSLVYEQKEDRYNNWFVQHLTIYEDPTATVAPSQMVEKEPIVSALLWLLMSFPNEKEGFQSGGVRWGNRHVCSRCDERRGIDVRNDNGWNRIEDGNRAGGGGESQRMDRMRTQKDIYKLINFSLCTSHWELFMTTMPRRSCSGKEWDILEMFPLVLSLE